MARRSYLTSLLEELQAKILTEVSNNHLKYAIRMRAACKSFANVQKQPYYLKGVSILNNSTPSYRRRRMSEYLEVCYVAGNLEVMLIIGVTGFLYDHFDYPVEGLEWIKTASKGGCEFAKYVYEIIRKYLWIGEINANDVPELSYDATHEIRTKIVQMDPVQENDFDLIFAPHVTEALDDICLDVLGDCQCYTYYDWRDIEDPMVKELEMCSACF